VIDVGPKVAPRIVGVAWHADRYHSAAASAFVDTARAVAAEAIESLRTAA
jgi:hypothetical protein